MTEYIKYSIRPLKYTCLIATVSIFSLGGDDGPLITILFTIEESNGNCLNQTLPYRTLQPTDIETGELVPMEKLKKNSKVNCLYQHNKQRYPAIITKIKRRSASTKTELEQTPPQKSELEQSTSQTSELDE
uniref:Uncharacterized protein n=1 Tax=Clytia hemisphaerica TaxID=252671 RepID=A0A7M6DRY0_9CNID